MTTATVSPAAELAERIISEGPIGMTAAARLLGEFRKGKPTHPSTLTRWAAAGVLLPGGQKVKLETVRIAGRLMTSRAAIVRFVAAQNHGADAANDDAVIPSQDSTPSHRRRQQAAASAELDAALA